MTPLPPWARVTPKRRDHIARVVEMLDGWAQEMDLAAAERTAWTDAGWWHDALRDAPHEALQELLPEVVQEPATLHGPAAALCLERDGETRRHVLDAVRYHTVGHAGWDRTGRALYMADYLEPGRAFARRDRAFLAAVVPRDFDGVFRQVVRQRLERALREGHELYPETVALWNAVR